MWSVGAMTEFNGSREVLEAWVEAHYAPLPTLIYREFAESL